MEKPIEKKIVKFGDGAHVVLPKEYIGCTAEITIKK
jgi:putative transposon-encoded protein